MSINFTEILAERLTVLDELTTEEVKAFEKGALTILGLYNMTLPVAFNETVEALDLDGDSAGFAALTTFDDTAIRIMEPLIDQAKDAVYARTGGPDNPLVALLEALERAHREAQAE